jgi:hypothetical protein
MQLNDVISLLLSVYGIPGSNLGPEMEYTVTCMSESITVPTSRFLATDFNTVTITVSLNYTHKVFFS